MRVRAAGIVLAAGASRRLGRPKQLLVVSGEPLVRRAARLAFEAGCDPVLVVLGAHAEAVRAALDGLRVEAVLGRRWREGMAASIRAGIESLERRVDVPGALLTPCDQPELDASVLRRLLTAFDGEPRSRVAAAYAGVLGAPAVFGRAWFADLRRLTGDRGARSLLQREPDEVLRIAWPGGARDIDRPDDLGEPGR